MSLPRSFAGVDRRTAWFRLVLLSFCLLGLLASHRLWSNSRLYPLLPIVPHFPTLPVPWDTVYFAAMLLSLILAVWFYRAIVTFFLIATLYAYCEDQNRGQPWLYLYWMLLLFTLLPASVSMAACRCAISVAYIWSGVQKMNPRFFKVEPAWFVEPAAHWHLPAFAIDLLRWGIASAPFVELGIGLALWSSGLRRVAIVATILVHVVALLLLGPLGHQYNVVVWPWNLAMIALVCVLFCADPPGLVPTVAQLRQSKLGLTVVALYSLLPILSYAGWWDTYFSFSLYAENSATANIFVTPAFRDRLPPAMRAQVIPFPFGPSFDPQHQGPFVFTFGLWCWHDLGVPFNSEPRNFRAMFNFLRAYAPEPDDLRMIVGPRAGPVIFYEGGSHTLLAPSH